MIKKNMFDVCAGDCTNCKERRIKNLSLLTICTKKKVTTKYVPPDMGAIKLALERGGVKEENFDEMTDADLKRLEDELILLLKERVGKQ
jgi:hypothetical protein